MTREKRWGVCTTVGRHRIRSWEHKQSDVEQSRECSWEKYKEHRLHRRLFNPISVFHVMPNEIDSDKRIEELISIMDEENLANAIRIMGKVTDGDTHLRLY